MDTPDRSPVELLTALNDAWAAGRLQDLEPLLHPRSVIVGPDLTRLSDGRDACIDSYREFLASSTVHAFEERDVKVEEYDGAAILSYTYRIAYELDGERYDDEGSEVLVLVRADRRWQIAWRQVLAAT
jgi:uncharacterized protein DUF4440